MASDLLFLLAKMAAQHKFATALWLTAKYSYFKPVSWSFSALKFLTRLPNTYRRSLVLIDAFSSRLFAGLAYEVVPTMWFPFPWFAHFFFSAPIGSLLFSCFSGACVSFAAFFVLLLLTHSAFFFCTFRRLFCHILNWHFFRMFFSRSTQDYAFFGYFRFWLWCLITDLSILYHLILGFFLHYFCVLNITSAFLSESQ